jgi:hypothetical protein|tara:strand:- start:431 stop:634 length:204 start_codon:yes stop_codon:yes gene_type:complete
MTTYQNSYLIGIQAKYGDRALSFLNKGYSLSEQFANEFIQHYNVPDYEKREVTEWLQEGYDELMSGL